MSKLPEVVGLIFCQRMVVDRERKTLSLVGLFNDWRFRSFPAAARSFTAYAALYNGEGEGTIELVCTRLEQERDVYRYRRWYHFPGEGQTLHVEIKATKCVFPAPGPYTFTLRFDDEVLASRIVPVHPL